jgi:hypothetical protein
VHGAAVVLDPSLTPAQCLGVLLCQHKDTLWRHGGHPTLPPQAALQRALHRLEALNSAVTLDVSPPGLAQAAHRIGVLCDRAAAAEEGGGEEGRSLATGGNTASLGSLYCSPLSR